MKPWSTASCRRTTPTRTASARFTNPGQPVLVGTISIEKSEHLANLLKKAGIPHQVLNAKQHEREAKIISQAGRKGAVTVSTNMAGRGTDILLGGNPEAMTREYCLHERLAIPYIAAPAVIGGDGSDGNTSPNMVLFQQEGKIFQVPAGSMETDLRSVRGAVPRGTR